ncbi:MAG: hypothetical protein KAY21_08210 [Limnohabitans sp.]|nr:hypothetical protein [Limnohabitans sp.]
MNKPHPAKRKPTTDRAVQKVLRRAFDFASRSPSLVVDDDIPLSDDDRAHLARLVK